MPALAQAGMSVAPTNRECSNADENRPGVVSVAVSVRDVLVERAGGQGQGTWGPVLFPCYTCR